MKHRILLVIVAFVASTALAQTSGLPGQLKGVTIEQNLNHQLPLNLVFKDETGKTVHLQDYFGEKPVVLSMAYYHCPMLCPYVLNGMAGALKAVPFDAGKQFTILTISFDPTDTPEIARAEKQKYMKQYGRAGTENGWHFLTGTQENINAITKATGFYYEYDASTGQYGHASAIMIATPEGKLARYFYGIEYPPKDLRLALVEASENKIGSVADQLLLFCFHYDPSTGKYSAYAVNFVRLGGVLTVLALGLFVMKNLKGQRN